jgi:hypothetical protein
MTGIRRTLVLLGLALTVTIGPAVPASATYSDSVTLRTEVATGTVAAPSAVRADVTYCHPVHIFDMTVSWPASTTERGVTGYRVTAHLGTGVSAVLAEVDAATLSVSARIDRYYLRFHPRVSVTTLTSYGWTSESPRSAVTTC